MGRHKHKNRNRWKQEWNEYGGYEYSYIQNTKLYIEPKAYEKLVYYTQLADGEISGFGKVKESNNKKSKWLSEKKYILTDVIIFNQRSSGGGTTLNGEQLSQFIVEIAKRKEEPHDWRLWWHTHYDFGVCWSGIDEMAIEDLLKNKEGAELLSICLNQDLDIIARRDTYKGNGNGRWYNPHETLDVRISPRLVHSTYLKCESDIKEKVKKSYIVYKIIKNWKKWNKEHNTRVIIPEERKLLTYTHIPIISTVELRNMGLYFNWCTGLYVRISDGQGFLESEVISGLYKAK